MRFFSSDHHFFHRNILTYEAEYRPFRSVDEMHDTLISRWNDTVKPEDEVYYLGDFALCSGARLAWDILEQLHGTKYLIRGNHDRSSLETRCFAWAKDEYELELHHPSRPESTRVRLCHYPYVDDDLLHMRESEVLSFHPEAPRLNDLFEEPISAVLKTRRSYNEQRAFLTERYGLRISTLDRDRAEPLRIYLARNLRRFTWRRPRPDGRWLLHGHVHGLWRAKPTEKMVNVSVEAWGLRPTSEFEVAREVWREVE